jgi:hypothetical protein
MNQALYAHINNKRKMKKKIKEESFILKKKKKVKKNTEQPMGEIKGLIKRIRKIF